MNYIFDTNIIIDALRQNKEARDIFAHFDKSDDNLFISSITGFELFSGNSSKDKTQIERIRKLLMHFSVIDLNWSISNLAGKIYRDETKDLEVPDYIIAATAMEIGALVVTLNRRHFSKISGIVIYSNGK